MRLTTFTDYTIRVLIYLALPSEKLATTGELADSYGISHNHITKVVHYLGQKGYIVTIRGKGGGIRLAREPQEISIGTLVRGTEENSILVECFDLTSCHCKILPACRLTGILREAQNAFYDALDNYTLLDLIKNTNALDNLLSSNR